MDDFIFSSNSVYENLNNLKLAYPFVQIGSAGKSVLGKDISFVRVGRGQKEVFYSASIHANEWITSIVLLEFLFEYCNAIQNNGFIWNFSAQRLFNSVSIYIMPIVNPDGVDLVTGSILPSSASYKQTQQIASNFPDIPFVDGWKANIRGVELSNFQHTLLINHHLRRFLCTNLSLRFLHILFFHYLLINYHLLYLSD